MGELGAKCCYNTKYKGAEEQIVSEGEDILPSFEKNK